MDAKFLELYNQELKFVRESGSEFAKEYPKIAGRLGLEGFDCSDPYVERLLEGFAFLSARVHRKLDASFPEFTQHLLNLLFPTFLQPIPSSLIAQFNPDFEEGSLLTGVTVEKGTSLFSQLGKDELTPCEYKTVQDVTMWPVNIAHAQYLNAQELSSISDALSHSKFSKVKPAKAAVKLVLEMPPGMGFSALEMDTLSLHLRGTESFPAYLFEAMYKGFIALMYKAGDALWRESQEATELTTGGFDKSEALLPYCNRQFDGFRLLREYFVFPTRLLFLHLNNIRSSLKLCNDNKVELLLLLDHSDDRLENLVSEENFALHCTPAINLFAKRAERINLSHKTHEFHVVPDRLRPMDFEVCAIRDVKGFGNSVDQKSQLLPLYSHHYSNEIMSSQTSKETQSGGFYTSHRGGRNLSANGRKFGHRSSYIGSELFVSIVDPKLAPYPDELQQLSIETLCSNRDLPLMMPLGKGKTDFTIETGIPCSSVRCVGEPTRPLAPLNDGKEAWDLINLLSINFLGFSCDQKEEALGALQRLLMLMSDKKNFTQRKQIDGLVDMEVKQITDRLPMPGPTCFARGLEIRISLDENAFEGSSAFMLGMVLDQFFAQFVGINSFSKLVLVNANNTEIHQWPVRIGSHKAI
ncbi:type VI secretion system baseplate subunit TssF [Ningiella sp. W23]|uniref:type VI secretion system baseplate subunit TssF n=1 Tax=Ningiella sp. W23 TaxID=3023715 RepID=UPI003756CB3B